MSQVIIADEETRLALELFRRQTPEGQAFLLELSRILRQAQEANKTTTPTEEAEDA